MNVPGSITKPLDALEIAPAPVELQIRPAGPVPDGEGSRAARAFVRSGKIVRNKDGELGLESVIGPDERVRIIETDLDPWRRICALRLIGPTGSATGTGWFVGPRTLLTAGHCVHHRPFFGGWCERIEVSPGRDGAKFPFGTVTATRFSAQDRWVSDADPDFDVGCIHLEEPLGDQTGWFGLASLPPEDLIDRFVNVSGYPGDRGGGREQYFHLSAVLHVGPRRVFYDVDTAAGQSGAPVWIRDKNSMEEPVAIGVHAYGTGGTPFDLGITANSAPRITPELYDIINGWIDADARK